MRPLALLLLLTACAVPAISRLDAMKDQADAADWQALAARTLPACDGPADPACAEAHAIRAEACRRRAEDALLPAATRARDRDCAVDSARAALAAAANTPPPKQLAWRETLARALHNRRDHGPRAAACADNGALREAADTLLAAQPAQPGARFLAASARLAAAVLRCPPPPSCADLASAARLLTPAPLPTNPAWSALTAALTLEQRRAACPQP